MKLSLASLIVMSSFQIAICSLMADDPNPQTEQSQVLTYGEMHVVIGQQQHQGRVRLQDLVKRDHFYGVGALAGLEGEITIQDGTVTISSVNEAGELQPLAAAKKDPQAALLVGGSVPSWLEQPVSDNVVASDFDNFVRQAASHAGLNLNRPFMFMVEGAFHDVHVHVINGACPVHARIHNREIPKENRPYEREFQSIRGTVIGVYAQDAVGKLTHPSTSTHSHLIFQDPSTGAKLTGHLERVGIAKQGTLKLPKQ